jgi:hypothetical protein
MSFARGTRPCEWGDGLAGGGVTYFFHFNVQGVRRTGGVGKSRRSTFDTAQQKWSAHSCSLCRAQACLTAFCGCSESEFGMYWHKGICLFDIDQERCRILTRAPGLQEPLPRIRATSKGKTQILATIVFACQAGAAPAIDRQAIPPTGGGSRQRRGVGVGRFLRR